MTLCIPFAHLPSVMVVNWCDFVEQAQYFVLDDEEVAAATALADSATIDPTARIRITLWCNLYVIP